MNQAQTAQAAQQMQEYIDDHICNEITLLQLSRACGYSPYHAARIFKEATGKAPFDYIRSLRLTKAALCLRDEKHKVLDIALDFLFDSHEGFTRAFSKEFGIPPKKYSQTTPPIQLFMPEKVYLIYRQFHKGVKKMEKQPAKTIFVQIIQRPERKLLLKRGIKATHYFEYCEEVGCDIWPLLCSVKEALYEPVGLWLPDHLIVNGTSLYVQGVELPMDYNNIIPEGFELITLPPCSYMIFQGPPYDDENFMEEVGDIMDQIDRFNPAIYGYEWNSQAAPRFQLAPMGERGYIEARPVKPLKN